MAIIPAALEARIVNIELKQSAQAATLSDQSKSLGELKTKQEVQTTILNQHTDQNLALLRDQRQVITTVSAIKAIMQTGTMLGAMIKWIAGITMACVSIYAVFKMLQSGDFSGIFRIHH